MHAGLDQNSVLVGAGIWYLKNPVRDLHDRNLCQKNGVDFLHGNLMFTYTRIYLTFMSTVCALYALYYI